MNKNLLIILFGLLFSFNASAAFVPGDLNYYTRTNAAAFSTSNSWPDLANGWQVTAQQSHFNHRNYGIWGRDIYYFQARKGYMYDIFVGLQGMSNDSYLSVDTHQDGWLLLPGLLPDTVGRTSFLASDILQGGNTVTNLSFQLDFLMEDTYSWGGTTFSVNETAVPLPAGIFMFLPALGFLARRRIRTN